MPWFGHMHEDHSLELALLSSLPIDSAIVIASGGDLAFRLIGKGVVVTAVDTNENQIDLLKRKILIAKNHSLHEASRAMTGNDINPGLCFSGKVDRILRHVGRIIAWIYDWPEMRNQHMKLVNMLLPVLKLGVSMLYGMRAGSRLTPAVIDLMKTRFEAAASHPDSAGNPLLQVLLGNGFGAKPPEVWTVSGISEWQTKTDLLRLEHISLGDFLKSCKPASQGLISISNLYDLSDSGNWGKLLCSVEKVLAPGGYMMIRSMLANQLESQPTGFLEVELTGRDFSPLCPVIWVGRKT